ncbi:MAG: hypothetical protein AB7O52_04125 [Planctomycetota bacterium]
MRARVFVLFVVPFLSGCLIMGGGNRVEFDDEIRYDVYFESPKAAREFYEAFDGSNRDRFVRGGGVIIPFVWATGGMTYYETQHFNDMVRRIDADRDDCITEAECAAYRGQ